MGSQSYYKDKDGNLIHTRSGDMIKRRIVVNKFTGEGELVDVESKHDKPKKEKKKDSKMETLLNCLRSLELDVSWAIMIFDSSIEKPITNKNFETLLKNLETLKSNVDTVIAFAKKIRSKT